jgi:hypothetical protein
VDAYISINGNVVSDHGNKIALNVLFEELDATAFGASAKVRRGGLQDGSVDITFLNDFVAAQLDAIFWGILGTVVPYEVRPTSAARSTGNPAYTGNLFIKEWKPIHGDVGKLAEVQCAFPTSGLNIRQVV